MECSASSNNNIFRIFKTFLHLSKINVSADCGGGGSGDDGGGQQQQQQQAAAAAPQRGGGNNNNRLSALRPGTRDDFSLRRNLSAYGRLRSPTASPTPPPQQQQQQQQLPPEPSSPSPAGVPMQRKVRSCCTIDGKLRGGALNW